MSGAKATCLARVLRGVVRCSFSHLIFWGMPVFGARYENDRESVPFTFSPVRVTDVFERGSGGGRRVSHVSYEQMPRGWFLPFFLFLVPQEIELIRAVVVGHRLLG